MSKTNVDEEEENDIVGMYESGLTGAEIARELGRNSTTIYSALKRRGVIMREQGPKASVDWVEVFLSYQEYKEGHLELPEVLKAHGITLASLEHQRRVQGIETKANDLAPQRKMRDEIAIELYKEGRKIAQIRDITGLSLPMLYEKLKQAGVPLRRRDKKLTPERILGLEMIRERLAARALLAPADAADTDTADPLVVPVRADLAADQAADKEAFIELARVEAALTGGVAVASIVANETDQPMSMPAQLSLPLL